MLDNAVHIDSLQLVKFTPLTVLAILLNSYTFFTTINAFSICRVKVHLRYCRVYWIPLHYTTSKLTFCCFIHWAKTWHTWAAANVSLVAKRCQLCNFCVCSQTVNSHFNPPPPPSLCGKLPSPPPTVPSVLLCSTYMYIHCLKSTWEFCDANEFFPCR